MKVTSEGCFVLEEENDEFQPWLEKYRPQKLDEVIGQEVAVERMKALLKSKNIPHMLLAGPAGVGKCVTGDTLVSMGDGRIEFIREIVEREFARKKSFTFMDGEAVLGDSEEICSIQKDDLKLGTSKILSYSRFPSKKIIEVTLESGKQVKVTPEHPFFTADKNSLRAVFAEDLRKGEFIACPRKLSPSGVHEIILETDWLKEMPAYAASVQDGFLDLIPKNKRLRRLRIPTTTSSELLELLGLLTGDGHLDKKLRGVSFYTEKAELIGRFTWLSEKLFAITPTITRIKRSKSLVALRINSIAVGHFVKNLGLPAGDKAAIVSVPHVVEKHDNTTLSSYLRGLFDCDGSVTRNTIEYCTASKVLAEKICLLLLRYGILARSRPKPVAGTYYFIITITGQPNLDAYREHINFFADGKRSRLAEIKHTPNTNVDLIPSPFYSEIMKLAKELKLFEEDFDGNYLPDYEGKKYLGRPTAQKVVAKIKAEMEERLEAIQKLVFLRKKERIDATALVEKIREALPKINKSQLERQTGVSLETMRRLALETHNTHDENLKKICCALADNGHAKFAKAAELIGEEAQLKIEVQECAKTLRISSSQIDRLNNLPYAGTANYVFKNSPSFISEDYDASLEKLIEHGIKQVSEENIATLKRLEAVINSDVFWDRVRETKIIEEGTVVYDLTVANNSNFVASSGIIVHNTTTILALARELYGDAMGQCFMELNASDERGIDVVRGRVKDFARTLSLSNVPYRLILLDEADSLTDDAQHALRRTMEKYSENTRFALSANFSSKIIEPIQSRCAIFRFRPLQEEYIRKIVEKIAHSEKIRLDGKAMEAIIYVADGDARRATNLLQGASALSKDVKEEDVLSLSARARPKEISEMLSAALKGSFSEARKQLDELMVKYGMSGEDVISQVYREVTSLPISDAKKIELVDKIGEYDFRISQGADPRIQLEALIAQIILVGSKN